MRGLIVFCFVAVAAAIPQGYNYQQGSSSSYEGAGSIAAPSYSHHEEGSVGGPSYSGTGGLAGPSYSGGSAGGFGGGAGGLGGGLGGSGAGEEIIGTITKNFYTHSAPEETEDDIQSDSESTGPTNKKYNVVFVKAPGQSAKSAALALRKAQSNEKTLIYVLNKQLDASELANALHDTQSLASNKPEVAFIKYKTPEEATHAQHQIQQQYEALGGGPSFVGEEEISPVSSVVGSLGSSGGHGGHISHGGHAGHGGSHGHIGSHGHAGHAPAASSSHGTGYLPPIFY